MKFARLHIPDGTLEALKWLALALMVLDHVDKWIWDGRLPGAFEAGRVVAPTFAFILAYNLARPGAVEGISVRRVALRLALSGLLATPAYMALTKSWWPLNIMFTLLASVAIVHGLTRGRALWLAFAGIVFVAG